MNVSWNLISWILIHYIVTMHCQNVHVVFNFAETVHLRNESHVKFKAFTAVKKITCSSSCPGVALLYYNDHFHTTNLVFATTTPL